jgi:hypothetical protein
MTKKRNWQCNNRDEKIKLKRGKKINIDRKLKFNRRRMNLDLILSP